MQSAEPALWPELSELKLQSQYDKKFRKLVDFLNKYPHVISKSPQGEITVHGKTIPDSSFSDLIRGLYVHPPNLNLHGQNEFHNALSSLNLPPAYISSKAVKAKLFPESSEQPKHVESFAESTVVTPHDVVHERPKRKLKAHSLSQDGTGKRKHPPPGKKPRILRLYH